MTNEQLEARVCVLQSLTTTAMTLAIRTALPNQEAARQFLDAIRAATLNEADKLSPEAKAEAHHYVDLLLSVALEKLSGLWGNDR